MVLSWHPTILVAVSQYMVWVRQHRQGDYIFGMHPGKSVTELMLWCVTQANIAFYLRLQAKTHAFKRGTISCLAAMGLKQYKRNSLMGVAPESK